MSNYREAHRFDHNVQTLESVETKDQLEGDSARIALPLFSMLIILLAAALIFFVIRTSPAYQPIMIACPHSQCATNIYSGAKRCPPSDSDQITYDPTFEVCNVARGCSHKKTPFIMYNPNLGGISTVNEAICPSDIAPEDCLCLSFQYCPDQAVVYFDPTRIVPVGPEELNAGSLDKDIYVQKRIWKTPSGIESADLPLGMTPGTGLNVTCMITLDNFKSAAWPPEECISGSLVKSTYFSGNTQETSVYLCADVDTSRCDLAVNHIELDEHGEYFCVDGAL